MNNRNNAINCQQKVLHHLISKGKNTLFGKEHRFDQIKNYSAFKTNVPVREYEQFEFYLNKIFDKQESMLWPGLPTFFAKTSGTTGDVKYLPVTKEFLKCTQAAAKYMLCNLSTYISYKAFLGKKFFYLTDQQECETKNDFLCAAISTIKSAAIPKWVSYFSLPPRKVNKTNDPFKRIDFIIDAIAGNDLRVAVALPVYLSYFLKRFEERKGKKFREFFQNFSTVFLSGMNYEPYENLLHEHLGNEINIMENYSATEGNFAYQPVPVVKGMELICNQGIFYEFIPLHDIDNPNAARLQLSEVSLQTKYCLVISANNGLWAYKMNDVVEFVSLNPFRLIVSGRLKDIFSPFGEHMFPIQAEQAVADTTKQLQRNITEFLIIPDFENLRYKFLANFKKDNISKEIFSTTLHEKLSKHNSNYYDLVKIKAIMPPQIIPVNENFFQKLYATSIPKAQQKTAHLINDPKTVALIEELYNE